VPCRKWGGLGVFNGAPPASAGESGSGRFGNGVWVRVAVRFVPRVVLNSGRGAAVCSGRSAISSASVGGGAVVVPRRRWRGGAPGLVLCGGSQGAASGGSGAGSGLRRWSGWVAEAGSGFLAMLRVVAELVVGGSWRCFW